MPWDDKDRKGEETAFPPYVFHIEESFAGYTEYNDGDTCLGILNGKRETKDGDLEDHHLWLSVGKFRPVDDGKAIEHLEEPGKRMDPKAKMQIFLNSAIDAGVPLEERGESSLDMTMYAGLSVIVFEEPRSFTPKGESEPRSYRVPKVVQFLGTFDPAIGPSFYGDITQGVQNVKQAFGSETVSKVAGPAAEGEEAMAAKLARQAADYVGYLESVSKIGVNPGDEYATEEFFESARAATAGV